MLVLSRVVGEKIIVTHPDGDQMTITLVEIWRGRKLKIGVTAPRSWTVHRDEVQRAIDTEKGET